jgi:ATP-dependent 26S proteasome regulatory subunit
MARLLRVSDFCRRFPQLEGEDEGRYVDNLRVTWHCRRLHHRRRPRSDVSSSSSIHVSLSVCTRLSVQVGDLAWLSLPSISKNHRVPVRIFLIDCEDHDNEKFNHGRHHLVEKEVVDSQSMTNIEVPPIILSNLGVSPKYFVDDDFPMSGFRLERMMNKPVKATKVILQPLGRAPPTHCDLLLHNSKHHRINSNNNTTTNDDVSGDADNDDDHNDNINESWSLPSQNSLELLQESSLLTVVDHNRNETFYYQILSVVRENENNSKSDKTDSDIVFVTAPDTNYEIDSTILQKRDAAVLRLPPLSLTGCVPPHPNWKSLAKLFIQSPPRSSSSSSQTKCRTATRILHVVGTDVDHNLQQCIETASNMVGLQCFTVRGLAAFAHNQGHVVRTGSFTDQLLGIEAAFRYIRQRRMEPCVLYIQRFDHELSFLDEQLRHDQEDRFWNKFLDELGESQGTPSVNTTSQSFGFHQHTPPILVVLSTRNPLNPGPVLDGLVLPSIVLSLPDDEYICYLWSQHATNYIGFDNEDFPEGDFLRLLRGRPAREIIQLGRQMGATDNKGNMMHLEEFCQDLDATRRDQTSDVSNVSKVKWEDVGGLAHVRAEIMDAIELPLKHPHLFPSNAGGRSGILLYGPPGSGKTLIAKAVATECGLPFLSVKGPELLGSYVGESEANVRKIFSSARQAAGKNLPTAAAILFFDELDSLAPKRGEMNHGGGVMERVVASLLAELDGSTSASGYANDDGVETSGRVFVLGATNRPDLLDPSLLRPGRLDRLVYLGVPADDEERAKVLASQLGKMKLEGDALTLARQVVSSLPPRLSGADFSKLSSGAMLRAVRRLCNQAEQKSRRQDKNIDDTSISPANRASIDKILETWGPEKCTPIITIEDVFEAAKDVSPSITEEELERYERLRDNLK